MKKITLTILGSLLWLFSFGQWNAMTSPTTNPLTSVYFTDLNTGCTVASLGQIYRTTDAGVNWSLITTASNGLRSVSFGSSSKGCAVGDGGIVYYTTDGGSTWSPTSSGQGNVLYSVSFVNADTAYAVGATGTILKSINGGSFWSAKSSPVTQDLKSVCFPSSATGYAVGLGGRIIKTTNYGQTWTQLVSGITTDLLSVSFTDDNNGCASGASGIILKTYDGGASWNAMGSGTTVDLTSIGFDKTDNNIGYAVGQGQKILKTKDGGYTWYTQQYVTNDNLFSVYVINADNVFTVGSYGKILKTIDGGCAIPNVTLTADYTLRCAGSPTVLTAGGAVDYQWNMDYAGSPITVSLSSSYTVIVTGTASDGCSDTASINISVIQLPIITSTTPGSVCGAGIVTLGATFNEGTIYWYDSAGVTLGSGPSYTTPSISTTTSYWVTATNGCSPSSTEVIASVNGNLTASAGPDKTICDGTSTTIGGNPTVTCGTAPYTFAWFPTDSLDNPNIANPTAHPRQNTTYYVTVTDANSNSSVSNVIISVMVVPTVTVPTNIVVCAGDIVNASAFVTDPVNENIVWTNSNTTIGLSQSSGTGDVPSFTAVNNTTSTIVATISVYAYASIDCPGPTITYTITVIPIPTITATNPASRCGTGIVSLSATASDGIIHWWNSGTGGTDLGQGNTFSTPSISSSTTFYINSTNGCVTPSRTQIIATVLPLPNVTTNTTANTICAGSSVTLTGSGATSYSWSGGITDGTPFVLNTSTTFTVTGTDGNSCTNTATRFINVNPLPNANAGADVSICLGSSAILTAGSGGSSYTWYNGNSTISASQSTTVSPLTTTSYSVLVTGSNGCQKADTVIVTVSSLPAITSTTAGSRCGSGSLTLSATPSTGATVYWYAALSGGSSLGTGTSYTPSISVTTTYYADATLNGCTSTPRTAVVATIIPIITNNTISGPQTICSGSIPGSFTGITPSGGNGTYAFLWESSTTSGTSGFSNAPGTNNTSSYSPVALSSTTWFRRTVTSGACSDNLAVIQITVNPVPVMSSASAASICSGSSVNISLNSSVTSTYAWVATDNPNTTGESTTSQTTSTLSNTITNSTVNPQNIIYSVIPTSTGGGCAGAAQTVTVTVNPGAAIARTSGVGTDAQTLCINTTISNITYSVTGGGTGAGVTGLPTGVNGSYSGGVFTISGTPTVPGTFTFTISTTGTCVQATATGTITVTPNAVIVRTSAVGTDAQALCINTAITNITYSVSGGGTGAGVTGLPTGLSGTFSSNIFTISGTPTVSGTFNYTVTTTGTCAQGTATGTITLTPNAVIALTSGLGTDSQTLCINTSLTNITYSVTGGGTGAGATGLPTGVSGSYSGGVFTISGSVAASGTFSFTVATTGTCIQSSASGSITVNPLPTVAATASFSTLCAGDSTTLTGTGNATVYTWNNSVSDGVKFSPGSTNSYIVTGTLNGCSQYDTIQVTVNPIPAVTANASLSILCLGDSTTLTGSGNASTYSWNNGMSDGVAAAPTATDTYIVTGTLNGCSDIDSVQVTVNPIPTVTANASFSTLCAGDSTTLTGSGSATTYTWNNGMGDGVAAAPASTNTYIVTGTLNGCSQFDSILVAVNPLPIVEATASYPTLCSGDSTTLTGSGATTYSWNNSVIDAVAFAPAITNDYIVTGTDGNNCSGIDTVQVIVNSLPIVNGYATSSALCTGDSTTLSGSGNATTYSWNNSVTDGLAFAPASTNTYIVTGTDGNNCNAKDTLQVIVNPLPIVAGTASFSILCAGDSTTLSGGGSATTYTWDNGVTDAVPFAPASTNTYIVTGTDGNNCSAKDSLLVTVDTLPIINVGSDITICAGQTTTLTASGGITYIWSTGSSSNQITSSPTTNTTYYVTGTTNNCSSSDTVLVTVDTLPIINAGPDVPVCFSQGTTLTASGGTTYIWSTGSSSNPITANPGTNTTYYVTGTTNNCSASDTVLVTVNPVPMAIAGLDVTICSGDTATLLGSGGMSYLWSPGSNSDTTAALAVNPTSTTTYSLTVTNSFGCTDTDDVLVSVTLSKDIYGHVEYSGGSVTNGSVVILKYLPFQTRFDSIQEVPLNSSGDYHFTNINHGNYLVKVFADTLIYAPLIATYYGGASLWNDPGVIIFNHDCDANDTLAQITMVQEIGIGSGPGLITGQVMEGVSFGRNEGDPIPGVDVELGKNPGGIMATTITDIAGTYNFTGVPYGDYIIYVDIPGLGRDSSYTITVDSTNNQFLHEDYIADSNSVYINPNSSVGISNPITAVENKFRVYPNPVIGNTTIEYSVLRTEAKITLDVYNVLGVKISSLVNSNQTIGNYKYNFNPEYNNLNTGVYFITLTIDGKTCSKRIVIME